MIRMRVSVPGDIPAQRELWKLAFGDDGAYVDNFYETYYRPERVLVLEEDGAVRSMTAWFDTVLVVPGQGEYRTAYLYAVATHPDCRGRGFSGQLQAWADDYFRSLGIPAVSTVPAEGSLHRFFQANGFRECFLLEEQTLTPADLAPGAPVLTPATAEEYGALRERLLAERPHILYPPDAIRYQEGCCRVLEGGLFRGETPAGPVLVCAESGYNCLVVLKEVLGAPAAREAALADLPRVLPAGRWLVRGPRLGEGAVSRLFGMVKMLNPEADRAWKRDSTAYLGLAFD